MKFPYHKGIRELLGVRNGVALKLTEDATSSHSQSERDTRWQLSGREKAAAQNVRVTPHTMSMTYILLKV